MSGGAQLGREGTSQPSKFSPHVQHTTLNMDELLSLFGEDCPPEAATSGSDGNEQGTSARRAAGDPVTGLRIVERRTSVADLVDATSSLTYASCAALAATSRAEWASHLVDGGGGSGPPAGRTRLATCGILTSSAASRLSKTGRAFAALSLGDLPSSSGFSRVADNAVRASVTVLLFGDALQILKEKKYLCAGYAVAVLGPQLLPPRDGDRGGQGATAVTLSVNDPRQVLPIGRAADCARCRGTARTRVNSDYGRVRWEEARCSVLVDTRMSACCAAHRRQGRAPSSGGHGGSSHMTFMQRQRSSHRGSAAVATAKPVAPRTHVTAGGRAAPSALSEALARSGLLPPAPAVAPAPTTRLLRRAPLHMKKTPSSASANANAAAAVSEARTAKVANPYAKAGDGSGASLPRKRPRLQGDPLGDALGDALGKQHTSEKSSARQAPNKRPRGVYAAEGYDGSVPVPKPSAVLFRRRAATVTPVAPARLGMSADSARAILEKQRSVKGLLRAQKGGGSEKTPPALNTESLARSKQRIVAGGGAEALRVRTPGPASAHKSNQPKDFASAFGDGHDALDREEVFRAQSRFAADADANEYARARGAVQELEAREAAAARAAPGRGGGTGAAPAIVTAGWACRTCGRTTPARPAACVRARHDVRQQRKLRGEAAARGTREERRERKAAEAGLTLGAGLEWSGWRGRSG